MEQVTLIFVIVIAIVTFAVLYLLTRQLNRLFPIGCFIPLVVAAGGVLLLLLGVSLYLDSLESISGQVLSHSETISAGSSGNWRRSMTVIVQYDSVDGRETNNAEFQVDGQTYDRLEDGGPAAVRRLAFGNVEIVSRLAEMDTRSLLGLGRAAIATWLPLPSTDKWENSAATIVTIRYIDHEYITDEDGVEQRHNFLQPVELVEFRFIPSDRPTPLVAVQKIDASSLDISVGGQAQVQYDPENPRAAVLDGAGHSYRWKNPVGQLGPGIAIIAFIAIVAAGGRLVKKIVGRKGKESI